MTVIYPQIRYKIQSIPAHLSGVCVRIGMRVLLLNKDSV